jgi:predicted TIM-barrel fold metal-dependent hydrolase
MNFSMLKNGIDTHFHVFNAGEAFEGARYVPQYNALLSDWTQKAKQVGITRGVWVQPSFLGTDNQLMVEALENHPDMLRGIAVVSPDVSLEILEVFHDAGVRGIRLNLAGTPHDISEWTKTDRLWRAFSSMGWHLEIHTDQGKLPEVLQQLPSDVALVIDHMGKPSDATSNDPTILSIKKRANLAPLFVKLSGAYRIGQVDSTKLATLLLNELGSDALLWGSDWPCTNHESFADFDALIEQAHAWIPANIFEQVLWVNPMKLYWD